MYFIVLFACKTSEANIAVYVVLLDSFKAASDQDAATVTRTFVVGC